MLLNMTMTEVYSKALNQTLKIDRIISQIKGEKIGPTLIFFGGIHGNETSGVFALHKVFEELNKNKNHLKGSLFAISGNLWALEKGKRFHKQDLNRIWTSERMRMLENGYNKADENEDIIQQKDIYKTICDIIEIETGPFYFFDLHTTSGKTIPFLTVNDSLLNRKFTTQYPIPMILGIEEYLNGPMLSFINELGYVSFGFEAGQHDDPIAIENAMSFIYLSLVFTNVISKNKIDFNYYYQYLYKYSLRLKKYYEIFYRYEIGLDEKFIMMPGFENFQEVKKGQNLATSNGNPIFSNCKMLIFMPQYQTQGNDGYFSIRSISPFFLMLSTILRKIRMDRILPLMPGVKWDSNKKEALIINLKIARFLAKPFLHLLGYRSKQIDSNNLLIKNREASSKKKDYKNEKWNRF